MVTKPCSELFRDRSKIGWRDRETFSIICICRIVSADFWTTPYTSLGIELLSSIQLITVQYRYFFSLRVGKLVTGSSVSCWQIYKSGELPGDQEHSKVDDNLVESPTHEDLSEVTLTGGALLSASCPWRSWECSPVPQLASHPLFWVHLRQI